MFIFSWFSFWERALPKSNPAAGAVLPLLFVLPVLCILAGTTVLAVEGVEALALARR